MSTMHKPLQVLPYNPVWPHQFAAEAEKITLALGDALADALTEPLGKAIHHCGSTAVPGLPAKPIIDIVASVKELTYNHQPLLDLGYDYRGSFNLPLRKSFTLRPDTPSRPCVNLHVFEEGDPEIDLNLMFRDHLRSNAADRERYAKLKLSLVKEDASHRKNGAMLRGYTLGKHDMIAEFLRKGGYDGQRLVFATHHTEWETAKYLRNNYFFEPNKIEDPYTWTFDHKDHKHFIFYKGVDCVGYAHLQLWPENRAAIRIIVIDEKHRGKGYGKRFMTLIEKWLKLQGYNTIHTESSPGSLEFYKRIGYVEMPFNDPDGYEGGPEDIELGKRL